MADTTMQHAFADAKPASLTAVRLVTRSRSGTRVWFSDKTIVGRRFRHTIDDDVILLEEAGPNEGKQVAKAGGGCYEMEKLGGATLREELSVKPTYASGRLAYAIKVPGLAEGATAHSGSKLAPRSWTDRAIRAVLGQVRAIEAATSWRIAHDPKTGVAIFTARLE